MDRAPSVLNGRLAPNASALPYVCQRTDTFNGLPHHSYVLEVNSAWRQQDPVHQSNQLTDTKGDLMKTLSATATKTSLSCRIHPYESTLSKDALPAQLDERAFQWGEYQEVEAVLHEKSFQHDIQVSY
jgi:hypothetical protein